MAPSNDGFNNGPRLENGPQSSALITEKNGGEELGLNRNSSTFNSKGTGDSQISSITKVKLWATGIGEALKPKVNKGKAKLHVSALEDHPLGYPQLACYVDSDESFTIYRRFGILHARLLLQKQDELRELEDELFTSDAQDEQTTEGQRCLRSRELEVDREEWPPDCRTKKEIFHDVQHTLLEYGQILKQSHELNSMNKPHERDSRSLINFVENKQMIRDTESGFVYHKEDLVSLRTGRENAWLDAAVEAFLRWYPCKPIKKLFCTPENRAKTTDKYIHYFSRKRINFVVTLLITLIILVLLVVPVVGLFELTQRQDVRTTDALCIGILLVSTLVFSSVLSMFTKAKRHEILAAAAAYCAVLVVFVGNVKGGRSI